MEFEKVWRTRRINSKSLFTMAVISLIGCVENKKSNYTNNHTLFLYITLIDLGSAVYCRRRTWSWLGWLDEWMGGRNGRAYAAAVIPTTVLVTNYLEPAAQWWRDRIWHFTKDHVERPRYKTISLLTSIGAPGLSKLMHLDQGPFGVWGAPRGGRVQFRRRIYKDQSNADSQTHNTRPGTG